ncbi:LMBR1-like membrane protein [Blastocladiella britannica]|nr:LMBR1-like membrane protein [Blastocladiella britannica]
MVNIVLLITSIVFGILVVFGAVYFLVYFQHPDDKWVAWFPKFIVVLGFSVSCYNIFLLPLDVANQGGQYIATGGLPMYIINMVFFITTVVMGAVMVPFVMFYYEGVDDKDSESDNTTSGGQFIYAFKWLIPTLIIICIIDFILWQFLGWVDLPIVSLTSGLVDGGAVGLGSCANNACAMTTNTIHTQVSILIATVAFATLIGWLLFSVFAGVGLIVLPFDLLMEFKHRPKPIKADVYATRKKIIGEQATLLMEAAKEMDDERKGMAKLARSTFNKKARTLRSRETQFKKDVMLLEEHYRILELSYKNPGVHILWDMFKAFVGFIGIFLSLFWLLHICLYMIPPIFGSAPLTTFLNGFFVQVSNVPFVGVALYAVFTFWLQLCVIKGTTKVGMRILFMSVHPMRIGETLMASMVFNVGLILFSSLAVAQFSTTAFTDYARYTSSQTIFVAMIRNLSQLQYAYTVLTFVLLGFAFLSLIFVLYKPYQKQQAKGHNIRIKF